MKVSASLSLLWVGLLALVSAERGAASRLRGQRELQSACKLPTWKAPADLNIGVNGLEWSQTIDTSCASRDVTISMDLSHSGALEESNSFMDTLQAYYKVDGGSEVMFLNVFGESYDAAPSVVVASGSQLTLRVVGKTTHVSEEYQIKNLVVVGDVTPPTQAPTKAPVPAPTPAPVAPPLTPSTGITGFKLIYTPTNEEVFDLYDNAVVSLQNLGLPSAEFNVKAESIGTLVQSVRFQPSGQNESNQPFAYCGDSGGDYKTCDELAVGTTHTVTVTPFTGSGTALPDYSCTFSIVDAAPPMAPPVPAPVTAPVTAPVAAPVTAPVAD